MKKLFIIRHGETYQPQGSKDDLKRELSNSGKSVLIEKVKKIIKLNVYPELIICSNLLRTRQTLNIISRHLQVPNSQVEYDHGLYNKDHDYLFNKLYATDDNIDNLMFIGHNPQLSDLASEILQKPIMLNMGEVIIIGSQSDQWDGFCSSDCRQLFYL